MTTEGGVLKLNIQTKMYNCTCFTGLKRKGNYTTLRDFRLLAQCR